MARGAAAAAAAAANVARARNTQKKRPARANEHNQKKKILFFIPLPPDKRRVYRRARFECDTRTVARNIFRRLEEKKKKNLRARIRHIIILLLLTPRPLNDERARLCAAKYDLLRFIRVTDINSNDYILITN